MYAAQYDDNNQHNLTQCRLTILKDHYEFVCTVVEFRFPRHEDFRNIQLSSLFNNFLFEIIQMLYVLHTSVPWVHSVPGKTVAVLHRCHPANAAKTVQISHHRLCCLIKVCMDCKHSNFKDSTWHISKDMVFPHSTFQNRLPYDIPFMFACEN